MFRRSICSDTVATRRRSGRPITAVADRLRGERGYTLTEMLIAMLILTVVVGGIMSALVFTQKTENRDANYTFAQNDARSQLDLMVSQIRQAWNIISSGPNFVDMDVNLNGTSYQVYYECDIAQPGTSYKECIRVQTTVGATISSLTGAPVAITNLTNGTVGNPVFSWGPSPIAPYYMTATINVPANDGLSGGSGGTGISHSIVFSDGALMRNLNVQN
jgi:prepilin-type N-terminal cleavage/methylation domain-containing protein